MNSLALWELSSQHQALATLMESDDLPGEVIRDTIESLEGDIHFKAVGCGHVIMNLEAASIAIADAAAKQLVRSQRLAKRAASLRAYLQFHLEVCGISKIEHTDFVLRLVNNTPSVIIDDPRQIPVEFMRTPEPEPPPQPVPDKPALAKALKEGIEVPGAHLFRGQRIDISL